MVALGKRACKTPAPYVAPSVWFNMKIVIPALLAEASLTNIAQGLTCISDHAFMVAYDLLPY
jgi:hypothetical protein